MELNDISGSVLKAALKVHSVLGPGLLEEPYKQCLAYELKKDGLSVAPELDLPVVYNAVKVEVGYRLYLLVENEVIVELKSVRDITPIHKAQLLTYLKLSGKHLGLILNFNTVHLKDGIVRMIN